MKIYLAHHEPGRMGGGWKFQDNLATALPDNIGNYEESDIYFIAGASMVSREEVLQAKADGKKIVLRVDNIPRNSRNRGTAMSRMKDFADWSDLVVYQTIFARDLLHKFLQPKVYVIILNSCDQKVFHNTTNRGTSDSIAFLYARSSSDETKNWEMARSKFQLFDEEKRLTIVGKPLDPKIHEYNFDLFMDEQVRYLGEIHDRNSMAELYRNHDCLLYSFFNDACSNTLIEAISCGMVIVDCYGMLKTGGAPEVMSALDIYGIDYFSLSRMAKQYKEALEKL